jgi:putative endonuclease
MNNYYVYILTTKNNKVMYVGMTNDLEYRTHEHKKGEVKGFTKKYNVNKLVYFEEAIDVNAAIAREKQLKGWLRKRKNELVVTLNPEWKDLSEEWQRDPSLCSG